MKVIQYGVAVAVARIVRDIYHYPDSAS